MRALAFLVAGLILAGCRAKTAEAPAAGREAASKPPPELLAKIFKRKGKPPQATPAQVLGEIRQVNAEAKFALVDTGSAVSVQAGEALVTISNGVQTSELKLTELRSPPFLIADIVSGKPAPGERVYRKE